MLTNYHTHTTRCGHAEGTEEEYILTALRCGYKVLGFSDHTPWAYATPGFVSHIRMLPAQLDDYVLTLRSLREKYADRLHLHIGLEAEYFPAYLGWLKEETERLGIEYLILGCHYDTTAEQDAKARRFGGSASPANGRRYAEQVERALETGLYRYLAHPALFLNRVTAFDAAAEKACADAGVKALVGKIATGDLFVGDSATKAAIEAKCAPDCVEMEGAAVSQIAAKNGVPCVILRAMSDNADEDGHEVLVVKKFSIGEYVATATKIVAAMVESL